MPLPNLFHEARQPLHSEAHMPKIVTGSNIRNLSSSLAQTFEPMRIKIDLLEADLSEFL